MQRVPHTLTIFGWPWLDETATGLKDGKGPTDSLSLSSVRGSERERWDREILRSELHFGRSSGTRVLRHLPIARPPPPTHPSCTFSASRNGLSEVAQSTWNKSFPSFNKDQPSQTLARTKDAKQTRQTQRHKNYHLACQEQRSPPSGAAKKRFKSAKRAMGRGLTNP